MNNAIMVKYLKLNKPETGVTIAEISKKLLAKNSAKIRFTNDKRTQNFKEVKNG